MCGIAGGLHIAANQVENMLSSLHHRGPDGKGEFKAGSFHGGMTRLAILDIAYGQQPFTSLDQRIHAVCNGEIYNWKELRLELEQQGHQFKTQCDIEILPAAWLEWGTQLPEKLNGMFALAIHDAKTDSLFLARDRCGQKPLYYTSEGPFVFASEIKAFAAAGYPLQPDLSHLSTWLSLRYLPEPYTMFKNIVTLPAAHWMLVSNSGSKEIQRYWKAEHKKKADLDYHHSSPVETLDQLTRSSVELALQSDAPVAAYLSGGVDSALLGHYIKDLGGDVSTLSVGFGATSDETSAASETAKHLNLKHHATQLQPDSLEQLPRIIKQMDRPVGDALILAFDHLAQHTASLGCKVALGGEGPDEHFAGYSFQKAYVRSLQLGSLGRSIAATSIERMPDFLLNRFAKFPASLGKEGREKTAHYIRNFSSFSFFQKATQLHTLFDEKEISQLLHPDLLDEQQVHPLIANVSPSEPSFNNLLSLQYSHWLQDWSLIRQDKNAMAHSVEYRAPFLDHRIINWAFTLPKNQKLRRGTDKFIWRALAAKHLPDSITRRPKQPFYLPLEQEHWRRPLLQLANDTLKDCKSPNWLNKKTVNTLIESDNFLSMKKLAALIILKIWINSFND